MDDIFYLKDLSKEDLFVNLVYRSLCNSRTLDDGIISYSKLTTRGIKAEDTKYLLDILCTNDKYIHDYLQYNAEQYEILYVLQKDKKFAEFYIRENDNLLYSVANYHSETISKFIETYLNYGLIEELEGLFINLLELLVEDPICDDQLESFKTKLNETKTDNKEVEDFLTKIRTLFSFEN